MRKLYVNVMLVCAAFLLTPFVGMAAGTQGIPVEISNPGMGAAIVPNADFVLRLDMRSANKSPILSKLNKISEEKEKNDPDLQEKAKNRIALEKATGMTKDDLVGIFVSGNLKGLDLQKSVAKDNIRKMDVVVALAVAKPLTLEKVKNAVTVLNAEKPDNQVQDRKLGGRPIVVVKPADTNEPSGFFGLSRDGKVIYVAFSESSLDSALAREAQTKAEKIPLALSSVKNALDGDSQGTLVFLAPEALREKLREQVKKNAEQQKGAPGDAGPGLASGFLTPLQNIKSISVGVKFTEDVDVCVAGDLGAEQDAQKESILMQSILMPIVQGMLSQQTATGEPPDIAKTLKIDNFGSMLTIRFKITEKDMLNRMNASQAPKVLGPTPIR